MPQKREISEERLIFQQVQEWCCRALNVLVIGYRGKAGSVLNQ
jgi:hypothetical protein